MSLPEETASPKIDGSVSAKATSITTESNATPTVVQEDAHSVQEESEQLNTDGRKANEWRSKYPKEACDEIRKESIYVGAVFVLCLAGIFLTWRGSLASWASTGCLDCSAATFNQFSYLFFAGLLGGSLFGIKYLYKVVARGRWHLDRRIWRIFSPWISGGLALAIGALMDAGIFGMASTEAKASSYFSVGFIAGYFADSALAKMQEIANTIFGKPEKEPSDSHHDSKM